MTLSAALVMAAVIGGALVAMLVIMQVASRRARDARSRERAEREGALGPEGLERAQERAESGDQVHGQCGPDRA
jgi:hypothetical protein